MIQARALLAIPFVMLGLMVAIPAVVLFVVAVWLLRPWLVSREPGGRLDPLLRRKAAAEHAARFGTSMRHPKRAAVAEQDTGCGTAAGLAWDHHHKSRPVARAPIASPPGARASVSDVYLVFPEDKAGEQ